MWQVPRMGESTGTFDFFTQLTILFTYIETCVFFFLGGGAL